MQYQMTNPNGFQLGDWVNYGTVVAFPRPAMIARERCEKCGWQNILGTSPPLALAI
jgi:hypothetical protein